MEERERSAANGGLLVVLLRKGGEDNWLVFKGKR
jgi:hypothetical protein